MPKLIIVHRWIGVALALFMALWLGTGLVITLTDSPVLDRAAQLAHAGILSREANWLGATEAWSRGGAGALPGEARLLRIANAPYWLFRPASGPVVALSARDGSRHEFSPDDAEDIAAAWLATPEGNPDAGAKVFFIDTGDAPAYLRNAQGLGPFHRLAVEDGQGSELIVSSRSGEVLAESSAVRRGLYYASSYIHLFHPLDFLGEKRDTVLAWAGGLAAVASLSGLIIGWKRWRPGLFGRPTYSGGRKQPYRPFWLAVHFWAGLIGGTFAFLWASSGFISRNPGDIFSAGGASKQEITRYVGGAEKLRDEKLPISPADDAVELDWRRVGDQSIVFEWDNEGQRFALPGVSDHFVIEAIVLAAQRLAGDAPVAGQTEIANYDSYYYRNRRQGPLDRPLPVLRIDIADPGATRLYVDPADGRVLLKLDSSRRLYRWLYNALHHWDFGWFALRPVWTVWMLTWASFGLALAVSAAVIAWRRLRLTAQAKIATQALKRTPQAKVSNA